MAVIKYHVKAVNRRRPKEAFAEGWEYAVCTHPLKEDKIISREKALEIIEKEGLVEVHRCKHGVIWDSPDEPLLEKFRGIYRISSFN